jgi:hypothetical protein
MTHLDNSKKDDYITVTVNKALIDNFAPIISISSNAVNGTAYIQLTVSNP